MSATDSSVTNGTPEGDSLGLRQGGLSTVVSIVRRHRQERSLLAAEQANDDRRTLESIAAEHLDEALAARIAYNANLRVNDPLEERRKSLPLALLGALLVAAVDGLPAYWAAEALGHDRWSTLAVAIILVAALAGFAALMTHFHHGARRDLFWIAGVLTLTMVAVQSGLRMRYLLVVNDASLLDSFLEAALLAGITVALVWVGYVLLHQAEPVTLWRERRMVAKAEAAAEEWRSRAVRAAARAFEAEELLRHSQRSSDPTQVISDMRDLLQRRARRSHMEPKSTEPVPSEPTTPGDQGP